MQSIYSSLESPLVDFLFVVIELFMPPYVVHGGILGLMFIYFFLCTVTDFSAGALPIGVKFGVAVRPDVG